MSEPTKDDREKAERWAELHGWKKVAFDLARFRAEAREEGRLSGRREMRDEVALALREVYGEPALASRILALPDTPASQPLEVDKAKSTLAGGEKL